MFYEHKQKDHHNVLYTFEYTSMYLYMIVNYMYTYIIDASTTDDNSNMPCVCMLMCARVLPAKGDSESEGLARITWQ